MAQLSAQLRPHVTDENSAQSWDFINYAPREVLPQGQICLRSGRVVRPPVRFAQPIPPQNDAFWWRDDQPRDAQELEFDPERTPETPIRARELEDVIVMTAPEDDYYRDTSPDWDETESVADTEIYTNPSSPSDPEDTEDDDASTVVLED